MRLLVTTIKFTLLPYRLVGVAVVAWLLWMLHRRDMDMTGGARAVRFWVWMWPLVVVMIVCALAVAPLVALGRRG